MYVSVDLQKVIMLPRMDNFKAAIFTKRVIAFNESFVPIGPRNSIKPLAVIWHEGVSGRKQEDLTSCYYAFFLFHKDMKKITIWLDNCSAQNKNWCFFTFLIFMINSQELETMVIDIFYFQPGHSFMSADSFHHQVELSMKHMGKIYDFYDYEKSIKNSNKGHVDVKVLDGKDFFDWKSECSIFKLNKQINRPMLNSIVHIRAERGLKYLLYSCTYDVYAPYRMLDFLKPSYLKKEFQKPQQKKELRGIHPEKKQSILKTLVPLMPKSRQQFWFDIPTSDTVNDLYEEPEN